MTKIKKICEKKLAPKWKVLLVDDDDFFLKMYATKFKNSGFKVLAADNVDAGIEIMRKERPDIVFLDIYMPKKNGFYLLNKAKKEEGIKDIPVVVLSNYDSADIREKTCKYGALYYVSKAYKLPRELVEFTREILWGEAEAESCGKWLSN